MTITFALILGHWAWSVEVVFVYDTWESRELIEERPYTIEDLYRDSPTDTPIRKMVDETSSDSGKVTQYPPGEIVTKMTEAMDRCAICGIGVTVPFHHDVPMCGMCHPALAALPPITHISDGKGITRTFTFGSGLESFALTMSFTKLGALAHHEIGEALAAEYRRATAPHTEPAA